METLRQKKVARLIQKELGEYFIQQSQAYHRGGLITVTTVRVSPDLAVAKVFLSIFPSAEAGKVLGEIQLQLRHIRGNLGNRIGKQTRIIPELVFLVDDSLDYLENIEKLLKN